MKSQLKSLALSAVVFLAACATYEPVGKDYTGPTATIRDSGFSEDGSKAQLFAVVEIDGNRVPNAFGASANASYGRGASLTTVFPERKVRTTSMRLKLRGSHATGAPIHAIASQMAGTFFSVEGVIEFTPLPNASYVVKGELKKEKSSVWLEDIATGKAVSSVITQ